MSTTAPLILGYAPGDDAPRSFLRSALWIASALPAATVPFLDFTWSVSPLDVAVEVARDGPFSELALVCAGLSFFLIFALIAWRMRLALCGRAGIVEMRLAVVGAILCNAPVVTLLILGFPELFTSERRHEAFMIASLGFGLIAGAIAAWHCRRSNPAAAVDALILGPYLGNALFCLAAFYDDPEVGYWLTAIACAILLPQLLLLPFAARRRIYVA